MYTYFVKSVDRVVDGDTIDISIDLGFDLTKKERVRLAGIDTTEKRTKDEIDSYVSALQEFDNA